MALRIFTEPQQGASYEEILAIARKAEACGFCAFFRSDHILKMGSASGLPATDAWITLAGLARDTSAIRLGTLVSPAMLRPVGPFSVVVAQVDHMSGGRLEVGLGAGWYEAEYQAFGVPFPSVSVRCDLLEDQLAILAGLWSSPPGSTLKLAGRTCAVQIQADTARPLQQPHPPVVLGGRAGPRSSRLAATYASEYNVSFVSPDVMKERHDRVRQACENAGRDPSQLRWSTAQVLCCGRTEQEIQRRAAAIGRDVSQLRDDGFVGTPAEILDKLDRFARHGADRFYLQVLNLADVDHLDLVAEEVLPHAPGV
jgi:alkanesulfonate monooxygenase SsuD/methylene tetrahydromethanopterin reductase-like flavin-dependent oxidoreductase (luciferase family)